MNMIIIVHSALSWIPKVEEYESVCMCVCTNVHIDTEIPNYEIQRSSKLDVNKPKYEHGNTSRTFEVCFKEVILLPFSLLLI